MTSDQTRLRAGRPRYSIRVALLIALLLFLYAVPARSGQTTCSFCRAEIAGDALYCVHCGKPVAVPDTIYCWRCGISLPVEANYCPNCGSRVCIPPADRVGEAGQEGEIAGLIPSTVVAVPVREGSAVQTAQPVQPAPQLPAWEPPPPISAEATTASATPSVSRDPPPPLPTQDVVDSGRSAGFRAYVHDREVILPSRLIGLPVGTILPSLALHAGAGLSFGFSDRERAEGWVLSLGLGGVGEATVSSSRIIHIVDSDSRALAGLRGKIPVSWISPELGEHLSMALTVAASGEDPYSSSASFRAPSGVDVKHLSYDHRETTLGLAATWQQERVRLHAILHTTDLRAENVRYSTESGSESGPDQKEVYQTYGLGLDYAVNPRTILITELRSVPRVTFTTAGADLIIENLIVYAGGLRFFPISPLGLDAFVAVDEEAVGLADLEIGFGLHVVIGRPANMP